jgi:branched-chain amino acid transport system permease protein
MGISFWLIQLLNGLSFSALLFMISIGFSMVFGLMNVINLSHATLYIAGCFIGIEVQKATGSFILAIIAGAIGAAIIGFLQEKFLLRRFHGKELNLVLLTTGIMMVLEDIMLAIWGGAAVRGKAPAIFSGPVDIFGSSFPSYRLFVIALGVVIAILMWFLIERTKVGATIRAGADNEEMAKAIGINIKWIFLATFTGAAVLAGAGGVLGGPILAVQPGYSMEVLTLALVVCTVGGMGTVQGVIFGSLFVGLVDSFGRALFPSLSYFTLFMPMAIILVLRPQGLFGRSLK